MIPETDPPLPRHPFSRFALRISNAVGRPTAFFGAVFALVVWAALGPMFHFSDTWQLFINTGTTIVTLLMVFLIQNTQNRDSVAIHIKLDELIRTHQSARNALMLLDRLDDDDLQRVRTQLEDQAGDPDDATDPPPRSRPRRNGARRHQRKPRSR